MKPSKGWVPEGLGRVTLRPGVVFPGDRQFALMRSSGLLNPASPAYLVERSILMLRRVERLAALTIRFDPNTQTLGIEHGGGAVESDLSRKTGCWAAEVSWWIIWHSGQVSGLI